MHVVIFAGGDFHESPQIEKVIKNADVIIAADSGAEHAVDLGIIPQVVIGDLDSLSLKTKTFLENKKVKFITYQQEKDETDTELAIDYAVKKGATEITILGGNHGDRFDHVIANLFLATTIDIPVYFIHGNEISWIAKGPTVIKIAGKKGDVLSLIPLTGDVKNITSKGLYYPLTKSTLVFGKPRGVSNVLVENEAIVSFKKGRLLFVHTTLLA